jgi:hypothetical protein
MEVTPETCVPDGSYSRNMSTLWKLLQKHAYLMEVTPETCIPDGSYSRKFGSSFMGDLIIATGNGSPDNELFRKSGNLSNQWNQGIVDFTGAQ